MNSCSAPTTGTRPWATGTRSATARRTARGPRSGARRGSSRSARRRRAPSTKPKRPLQRSHDGGLAGMIAACAKAPEEAAAEETSSSEDEDDEDESSVDDDEAPAAPAPGRVVGTVRKWDGRRGFIRLEGQASDAVLFEDNVRGGATLRVGDRVEFALRSGKKHPSAVDVAPLAGAAPTAARRPAAPSASCASSTGRAAGSRSRPATGTASRPASRHATSAPARRSRRATRSTSWPRNRPGTSATGRYGPRRRPPPRAGAAPGPGRRGCAVVGRRVRRRALRLHRRRRARQASRAAPWVSSGRRTPRCRGRRGRLRAHRGARRWFAPLRRLRRPGHNHIEIVGEGSASAPAPAPRAPPGSRAAGTVAWWKGPRGAGHGFIIRETGQEDLFVHESGLGAGLAGLRTGDRVTFRVGRAPERPRHGGGRGADGRGAGGAGGAPRARPASTRRGGPRARRAGEPATAGATHASHRATQHEVEAVAARVAAGLFAADGPLPINQFAARFKRRLRENERRLDADSQQRAWAYAESTLVTLDRSRRVVGVRDDAGAAAEARARQRGRERRAYYGTGGGLSEDVLLQRALEASRAENYAPHVQGPSPLDAAGEDEALMRALEASRQSYEREQRAQPTYAQPTYAPPPKAESVPPTYSSSFFSAPPPPPPPAPPVHSGGSSASEFEARVVSAGLARILPDLKKEDVRPRHALLLEEDDLKELRAGGRGAREARGAPHRRGAVRRRQGSSARGRTCWLKGGRVRKRVEGRFDRREL